MKIQVGEIKLDLVNSQMIPNRSRKLLLPCLKDYGPELVHRLEAVYKVAVGLGDMIVYNKYYKAPERHLFILIDTTVASKHFVSLLDWIQDKKYYEDDYIYGNIQKTSHHMLVIKFPQKYWDAFDTFKEGKYSEMFNREVIDLLFQTHSEAYKIVTRDHNYKIKFTKKLNDKYNTTIKAEEWEGELEFPPNVDFNEEFFE